MSCLRGIRFVFRCNIRMKQTGRYSQCFNDFCSELCFPGIQFNMVVRPSKNGQGPVKLFWNSFFSVVVTLLLYEGMVTAFHLLNLPSNLAVFAGMGLLLLLAVGGFVAFRSIWRRS